MRFVLPLLLVLIGVLGEAPLLKAEPESSREDDRPERTRSKQEDAQRQSTPAEARRLFERAQALDALREGTLSPSIDPAELLRLRLDDPMAAELLAALSEPPLPRRKARVSEERRARAALRKAWEAWWALPETERDERLAAHARRSMQQGYLHLGGGDPKVFLDRLEGEGDRLEAFLKGETEGEGARALLELDLEDETMRAAAYRIANDLELRLSGTKIDPELAAAAVAAQQRLDALRLRYLQMKPQERLQLEEARAKRKVAEEGEPEEKIVAPQPTTDPKAGDAEKLADEARLAKEAALAAMEAAKNERQRQLASASAMLSGLQEALAAIELEGREREEQLDSQTAEATVILERVAEIEAMSPLDGDPSIPAEELLPTVQENLSKRREELRRTLGRSPNERLLPEAEQKIASFPAELFEEGDLAEQRRVLRELLTQTRARHRTGYWSVMERHRQEVERLNHARLRLLALVSAPVHAAQTGFGEAGVRAVRGEVDHLTLDLSYWGRAFSHRLETLGAELRADPVAVGFVLLKLIGLLLVWGVWRRALRGWIASGTEGEGGGPSCRAL